jgi:hypothetical protein
LASRNLLTDSRFQCLKPDLADRDGIARRSRKPAAKTRGAAAGTRTAPHESRRNLAIARTRHASCLWRFEQDPVARAIPLYPACGRERPTFIRGPFHPPGVISGGRVGERKGHHLTGFRGASAALGALPKGQAEWKRWRNAGPLALRKAPRRGGKQPLGRVGQHRKQGTRQPLADAGNTRWRSLANRHSTDPPSFAQEGPFLPSDPACGT